LTLFFRPPSALGGGGGGVGGGGEGLKPGVGMSSCLWFFPLCCPVLRSL